MLLIVGGIVGAGYYYAAPYLQTGKALYESAKNGTYSGAGNVKTGAGGLHSDKYYEITVPSDWTTAEAQTQAGIPGYSMLSSTSFVSTVTTPGTIPLTLNIIVFQLPNVAGVDFMKSYRDGLARSAAGANVKTSQVKLAGQDATKVDYSITQGTYSISYTYYMLVANNRAYILTSVFPPAGSSAALDEVLATFKVK